MKLYRLLRTWNEHQSYVHTPLCNTAIYSGALVGINQYIPTTHYDAISSNVNVRTNAGRIDNGVLSNEDAVSNLQGEECRST